MISTLRTANARVFVLFLLPALLFVGAFFIYPVLKILLAPGLTVVRGLEMVS